MISLQNIVLRRGAQIVLDDASALIRTGERAGLIGRNGAGKSSLFGLLLGHWHEDRGEVQMPARAVVASVEQSMPETSQSATDFVLAGDAALARACLEIERLEQQQAAAFAQEAHAPEGAATEAFSSAALHQMNEQAQALANAYAAWQDAGGADAKARAQTLIQGLGFTPEQLELPVNHFSGGWRMRLQLARALMAPSDVLLLDEPTNHLDLDALVWLEGWLKRYSGTMLVISHDREFLDAITDVTLHLESGKLQRYGGNYSQFEVLRAQAAALQQASYEKQQEKIAHLQKFITRFKAQASKAKQAQSRVKALARLEQVAPLLAEADFTFEFKQPAQLPNPMLSISGGQVGYQQTGGTARVIVSNVNRSVLAGERIGVLGANGQGKSTLVKTIAGHLPILAGQMQLGRGLQIGYFAQQELDLLQPEASALAHFQALARDWSQQGKLCGQSTREQDLRSFLGSFNFTGDQVQQSVGTLSGGERARLVLAMIVWQRPHLLLLDEPTNHLDLATRQALAMALNEFEGTVMLVSHDRALLRAVCDSFWLVADGRLQSFEGDLEDYQQYLLERAKQDRMQRQQQAKHTAAGAAKPPDGAASRPQGSQTPIHESKPISSAADAAAPSSLPTSATYSKAKLAQMRKEWGELEQQINALEQERTTIENSLGDFSDDPLALKAASERHAKVSADLLKLEERWLALGEVLQA